MNRQSFRSAMWVIMAIVLSVITLAANSSNARASSPPLQNVQASPTFYWGSDTDQYKDSPNTPLYLPSQDFFIALLGLGTNPISPNPAEARYKAFVNHNAPSNATYAYWTVYGLNPSDWGGYTGDRHDALAWGSFQADVFIDYLEAKQADPSTDPFIQAFKRIGGRVLFADVEGAMSGDSSTWISDPNENLKVVDGFLTEIQIRGYRPGLYTRSSYWNEKFNGSYTISVPFVLWYARYPNMERYDPRKATFPDYIAELEDRAINEFLQQPIAGYYPSIWQFAGDAGSLTLQDPANFVPRPVGKLDLVFVIDTTGSMGDDIAAVKASATEIVNALASSGADYRIALVDYRDWPYPPYGGYGDYPYHLVLNFSSDTNAITSAINGLTIGWGADWEESVYSGLMRAINLSWRDGAAKGIILMGDAPPHDPEPFSNLTRQMVLDAAFALDPAVIYPIVIGYNNWATAAAFQQLADGSGGQLFEAANASDVVDALLAAIGAIVDSPIANAGGPYTGAVGETITFDGSGSLDPDGVIVQYEWDFESDGVFDYTSAEPVAAHVYPAEFSGAVTLRVTDDDGLIATDTAPVVVQGLGACSGIYPIALHEDTLVGVSMGDEIDVYEGSLPGSFGWLSWTGDMGEPALVLSLTPPGDSETYVNPNDPSDHTLSVGDEMHVRPGVANSSSVRAALDALKGLVITVPVVSDGTGQGANGLYQLVGFARIQITDYRLPDQNWISAIFQGLAICGD